MFQTVRLPLEVKTATGRAHPSPWLVRGLDGGSRPSLRFIQTQARRSASASVRPSLRMMVQAAFMIAARWLLVMVILAFHVA